MNRNDVIDLLSVVAAATRRTVGNVDVDIWQEVIGDLDVAPCMKAVRAHLRECPGVWLEPGHVRQRVRAEIRDALERESNEERNARQVALDSRFETRVNELAATKALPGPSVVVRDRRPNPLTVTCPWCHAEKHYQCTVPHAPGVRPAGGYHPARVEAAAVNA